jgi:hypothetical protein
MDNKSALPNPIDSSQAADAQPIASPAIGAIPQQYGVQAQGTADALARASSAVEAVLAQTSQNPSARLRAIADIKATYIKEQFGVDIAR